MLRKYLFVIIGIVLVASCLVAGGLWWRLSDPARLANYVQAMAHDYARVDLQITGGVDVAFRPSPTVTLHGVILRDASGVELATVRQLQIEPDILPLLKGNLRLNLVQLDEPDVRLDASLLDKLLKGTGGGNSNTPAILRIFSVLIVTEGRFTMQGRDGTSFSLDGVEARFRFSGENPHLTMQVARFDVAREQLSAFTAHQVRLDIAGLGVSGLDASMNAAANLGGESTSLRGKVRLQAMYSLANPAVVGHGTLTGKVGYDPVKGAFIVDEGKLGMSGTIEMAGYATPFSLSAPFSLGQDGAVTLRDAALKLDEDSGNVDGRCTGLRQGEPVMEGQLRLHKLSLPRWFGFARQLPPGLQHALDAISGVLDFRLDKRGVEVGRLQADVLGILVAGRGGVSSFAAPVIDIGVAGPAIDVNRVIPEVMGEAPVAPVFSMAPPVPVPGSPAAKKLNIPNIGYDIRVNTDTAKVNLFDVGKLAFRCSPSPKGVLLEFTSPDVYGGSAKVLLDIVQGYNLNAEFRNVQIAAPAKRVAGREVATGTVQARMALKAPAAKTLKQVLASISGSLDMALASGSILVEADGKQELRPLSKASVQAKLNGPGMPATNAESSWLPFSGNWKTSWAMPNGSSGTLELDGAVSFSEKSGLPVACSAVPGRLTLDLPEKVAGLRGGLSTSMTAVFSANLNDSWFWVQSVAGNAKGIAYAGEVRCDSLGRVDERWSGGFDASHPELRALLPKFGIHLWQTANPAAFGRVRLLSDFVYQNGTIDLKQIQCFIDGSRIGGNVKYRALNMRTHRPQWSFDLTVDTFDVDAHLPPVDRDTPASETPWDLAWLRAFDVTGHLTAGEITYRQQTLTQVELPLNLRSGVLVVDSLRAQLYDGTLTGTLHAVVGQRVDMNLRVGMFNFQMRPLVTRYWGKDHLSGTSTFRLYVEGELGCDADIPRALDGKWLFEMQDGYYSLRGSGGTSASRTPFSLTSASGTLEKGVVRNDNFILRSVLLTMTGKGWINLAVRTIDYTVDVAFARVPNFPIHFQGPLSDPDVSVRGLGIITGTLENIGGGIFGLLEGVLTAPFKVLDALGITGGTPPAAK